MREAALNEVQIVDGIFKNLVRKGLISDEKIEDLRLLKVKKQNNLPYIVFIIITMVLGVGMPIFWLATAILAYVMISERSKIDIIMAFSTPEKLIRKYTFITEDFDDSVSFYKKIKKLAKENNLYMDFEIFGEVDKD